MSDINQVLGKLIGSGAAGGFAGGLAGGLAGNLLTSKSGRKLGKKTLQMGGVAAVGALAYAAYQRYAAHLQCFLAELAAGFGGQEIAGQSPGQTSGETAGGAAAE